MISKNIFKGFFFFYRFRNWSFHCGTVQGYQPLKADTWGHGMSNFQDSPRFQYFHLLSSSTSRVFTVQEVWSHVLVKYELRMRLLTQSNVSKSHLFRFANTPGFICHLALFTFCCNLIPLHFQFKAIHTTVTFKFLLLATFFGVKLWSRDQDIPVIWEVVRHLNVRFHLGLLSQNLHFSESSRWFSTHYILRNTHL